MVEHVKSADQIVAEAIAIHIDTDSLLEGYPFQLEDLEAIENALYWALEQAGRI